MSSKDSAFYFSHDYNTRNDIKIKRIVAKYGLTGYGAFWAIIEELYNNANALPTDYDCIAYDLRTDCEMIKSLVNDFDLFVVEGGFFWSESIKRRLEEREEKSNKASASARARWERNANAFRTESERYAIKERKGKEKKEENNKNHSLKSAMEINIPFEKFWEDYDKKVGDKKKLIPKWERLTDDERTAALQHISNYKIAQPDKAFRKNPETYLNNKSFNDEIIQKSHARPQVTNQPVPKRGGTTADLAEYDRMWEREAERTNPGVSNQQQLGNGSAPGVNIAHR